MILKQKNFGSAWPFTVKCLKVKIKKSGAIYGYVGLIKYGLNAQAISKNALPLRNILIDQDKVFNIVDYLGKPWTK